MLETQNTSIRNKLMFIQLATAFMAVLICCALFLYNDIRVYKETSLSNKYSIAEIVGINATPALEFIDHDAAKQMLDKFKSNPTILNAVIFDKAGKEFARYDKAGEEAFKFSTSDESDQQRPTTYGRKFIVTYKIITKEFLGTVKLRSELSGFNLIVISYVKIAALILLISLVVAFIISAVLQSSITNRLLTLVNKTKMVADSGDYSIRVPAEGKDEIAILSAAYNDMLGQIEKMQGVLQGTNAELERRVKSRTAELENANKELERFVYVASHDLQEPLRTISNYTGLIEEKYASQFDESANKYFSSILKAASRMRTLIQDLLELSRIGKNIKFEEVNTNEILKEVIAQLDGAIQESNTRIIATSLPIIKGNESELKQLFQNLISNAIKFRKKEGISEIKISAQEKPKEYQFSFQDNGIGIDEQYKDRIFVVFQRLHGKSEYPGTGIGLATCQKIVTLHKGKIWVESKLGEGSTFYFTISKRL